eukprot:6362685-Alexandrium_andersonii.AAC.1
MPDGTPIVSARYDYNTMTADVKVKKEIAVKGKAVSGAELKSMLSAGWSPSFPFAAKFVPADIVAQAP